MTLMNKLEDFRNQAVVEAAEHERISSAQITCWRCVNHLAVDDGGR